METRKYYTQGKQKLDSAVLGYTAARFPKGKQSDLFYMDGWVYVYAGV